MLSDGLPPHIWTGGDPSLLSLHPGGDQLPTENLGIGSYWAGLLAGISYRRDFSIERMTRFTSERDTLNVRAMVAGFRPAPNEARIRLAFPSGISAMFVCSSWGGTDREEVG